MNEIVKVKRWMVILIALVMVFNVVSTASALIGIPGFWIFTDVSNLHPFAEWIGWLKANGITSGYPDGSFRPNNPISRAEMAVLLKNTASTVVAAGARIEHDGSTFVVTDWFNNVNGQKPTTTWLFAHNINFGFDMTKRLVQCTVDLDDSVTSFCTAKTGADSVVVAVYDVDSANPLLQTHGFWILVYGNAWPAP